MVKHHKIAEAQKKHRRNRRKHFDRIGEDIQVELERKERIKMLKKAKKSAESIRKKAIENAEKDRIRLAKIEARGKKKTRKEEVKKVTKRTTKNGGTK